MSPQRILWYFADPMCSWCWGFAPVISAIQDGYQDRLQFVLVMGGLRPGTIEPVTPQFRAEILHHWQEVQSCSGQPFKIEGALPDGFIYDTEPPCRAVVTVEELKSEAKFAYFKSVQAAFYAEQQDVTQPDLLAALAEQQGVDKQLFLQHFETEAVREKTLAHFDQTARAGIRGFPTAVLQDDSGFTLLTHGYAPLAEVTPKIDAWLAEPG
jgi:putative protein-disulfide isomerase